MLRLTVSSFTTRMFYQNERKTTQVAVSDCSVYENWVELFVILYFTVLVYTNSDNRGFCKDKNLAKKLVIRFLWFLYVYMYIPRLQEITHSHELTKINFYIFRGKEFLVEWSPLHPSCGVTDQLHVTGAVR